MAPPVKPPKDKLPSLHGRVMVDTFYGKVRLRAWPQKRGPKKSRAQAIQVEHFTQVQKLYPQLKGEVANRFIKATEKTGLYPRDLFMKMATTAPIQLELDNGLVLRYRRPFVENVMFQGFALRLTANQAIASTTLTNITWPLPEIDTAGFVDAGDPTRITVPEGVAVMTFTAGLRRSAVANFFGTVQIRRLLPSAVIIAENAQTSIAGLNVSTGPIPVFEGEVYTASVQINTASTILAVRTFFNGTVLGAEI